MAASSISFFFIWSFFESSPVVLSHKEESQVGALYVHVPFCSHKCEYCAFYSELLKPDVVEGYVSALCKELAMVSSMVRPRTLFFGGGTPSLSLIHI